VLADILMVLVLPIVGPGVLAERLMRDPVPTIVPDPSPMKVPPPLEDPERPTEET
jgi:hypothetical protein